MARRIELQLFSTSFIDLMACALAGASILWVLTLEASSAAEPARRQRALWIRISQVGLSHFEETEIEIEIEVDPESSATLTFEELSARPRIETANGSKLAFAFEEPAADSNAAFGGWLSLKVEDLSENLTLRFGFGTCKAGDEIHDIQLAILDATGRRSEVFLYTRACELYQAAGLPTPPGACRGEPDPVAASERRRSLLDRLTVLAGGRAAAEVLHVLDTKAGDRIWTIEIRADATVEVVPPPLWNDGNEGLLRTLGLKS